MVIALDITRLTTEEKAMLDRIVDNCNGRQFADVTEAFAYEVAKSEAYPNNTDYVVDRVANEIEEYLYYGEAFDQFVKNSVDRAVEDDDELREREDAS